MSQEFLHTIVCSMSGCKGINSEHEPKSTYLINRDPGVNPGSCTNVSNQSSNDERQHDHTSMTAVCPEETVGDLHYSHSKPATIGSVIPAKAGIQWHVSAFNIDSHWAMEEIMVSSTSAVVRSLIAGMSNRLMPTWHWITFVRCTPWRHRFARRG